MKSPVLVAVEPGSNARSHAMNLFRLKIGRDNEANDRQAIIEKIV
jgi:hypothetical protein